MAGLSTNVVNGQFGHADLHNEERAAINALLAAGGGGGGVGGELPVLWDGTTWRVQGTPVASLDDVYELGATVNTRLIFVSPSTVEPPAWAPDDGMSAWDMYS